MSQNISNSKYFRSYEQMVQGDLFEHLYPKENQDPALQIGLFLAQVEAISNVVSLKCRPYFEAMANFSRRVEDARALHLKQLAA